MRYLSLFSGIGGFELGIQQAYEDLCDKREFNNKKKSLKTKWNTREYNVYSSFSSCPLCIGFSEIDKYAIQVYKKHFSNHKNYGDATKIDTEKLPNFDLLVAGFPCQAFSIAGKRRGFNDTRGTLFFEIARILRDKRPRYFLLENVKGLLSHDVGKTFQTILRVLADLGYELEWQVLNSKNFGVLQNRERVFIVGYFRGTSRPKVFPIAGTTTTNTFSNTIRTGGRGSLTKKHAWDLILRDGRDNRSCLRAGRITEVGIKGLSIRRLTPIECERLQSFPDNWTKYGINEKGKKVEISDTQRYKMLGNAVTVNVVREIIKRLKNNN